MSQTNAHILLLGDRDDTVTAHQAIPRMLALIAAADHVTVDWQWLPTDAPHDTADDMFRAANGIWCVPASPYASTEGALRIIRRAREEHVPFLGTCGGFQHAVLEFAANVRGLEAQHAELDPEAQDPVIAPLSCGLVEEQGAIVPVAGTRMAALYGTSSARESYHCRYGLSARHEPALFGADLVVGARDDLGEVRAIELTIHPFFVATLFQPERTALRGAVHPVPRAFVAAAHTHRVTRT